MYVGALSNSAFLKLLFSKIIIVCKQNFCKKVSNFQFHKVASTHSITDFS